MSVVLRTEATPTAPALLLRPWADDDVEALVEAYRDPVLRRWTRFPVTGAQDAVRWLRVRHDGWRERDYLSFAVVEERPEAGPGAERDGGPGAERDGAQGAERGGRNGTRLVGNVVLKLVDREYRSAEVGYWTAAYARGRGVAPRALDTLTTWAFDTFAAEGLEQLELRHQIDNPASCQVAEKTGFRYEATLPARPPFPNDGHLHVRRQGRLTSVRR